MKVTMYPAITLDGFIADPNGECYSWISEEDEANYEQAVKEAGCLLIGRKTYEQYKDEYPLKSGATTFVFTHGQDEEDQDKIKFVTGTPEEVLRQIADTGFNEVVIGGGGEVNGAFAEAGLIDEIIISIYNVTIGEGIPLFGSHKPKLKLKLLATSNELEGIVKNHYEVERGEGEL
jgi:dihydrofolate reductase